MHNFIILKNPFFSGYRINNSSLIFETQHWKLFSNDTQLKKIEKNNTTFYIFGDLFNLKDLNQNVNIHSLLGNFYIVKVENDIIEVYNSMFSILPIYYLEDKTAFSNSIQSLQELINYQTTVDKQFILENLLFNYGFFNRSLYKEIKLLNCNTFIRIGAGKIIFIKHTNIVDFFTENLDTSSQTRRTLASLFIEKCHSYFPDDKFSITFTGGFDGRTIVACANHFNKKFKTCSVGIKGNSDVEIPIINAKELGLMHYFYPLNEKEYIGEAYKNHAQLLNSISPGFNGYIYSHFSYLAEQEGKQSNYLLAGYFGSELLRALHISGAVTSNVLVKLFSSLDNNDIIGYIKKSSNLDVIIESQFKSALESLIDQLLDYKHSLPSQLTHNQKFYIFVFEEIFRKFFGTLINSQQQFINVRTPFLDFNFIKELLKTGFAGANNTFYTNNPLKRFKGQVVYSEIIKNTSQIIYHQKTGKGYSPSALIEPFGIFEIFIPFIKKRITRKIANNFMDNLGIISGFNEHKHEFISKLSRPSYLFNNEYIQQNLSSINDYTKEKQRDKLLHSLSIIDSIKERN